MRMRSFIQLAYPEFNWILDCSLNRSSAGLFTLFYWQQFDELQVWRPEFEWKFVLCKTHVIRKYTLFTEIFDIIFDLILNWSNVASCCNTSLISSCSSVFFTPLRSHTTRTNTASALSTLHYFRILASCTTFCACHSNSCSDVLRSASTTRSCITQFDYRSCAATVLNPRSSTACITLNAASLAYRADINNDNRDFGVTDRCYCPGRVDLYHRLRPKHMWIEVLPTALSWLEKNRGESQFTVAYTARGAKVSARRFMHLARKVRNTAIAVTVARRRLAWGDVGQHRNGWSLGNLRSNNLLWPQTRAP